MREEVVAHVVLQVARRPDQDASRPEAEHAAHQAYSEQFTRIEHQLGAGHFGRQIVDGVSQHQRRHERNGGGDDRADEP